MSDDDDAGGAAAGAARPARYEKPASSINCRDFNSETQDFDRWVSKFEKAVKLATNVRDDITLHYLYKEWLPLKLDDLASTYLEQIDDAEEWPAMKTQLSDLLVDPQKKLRWRARQWTITWDGKESMHALASRVTRAVDKYDRHLPQDIRDSEYFVRFRGAFKKPLMRVIDMNCPEGSQTIDTAKDAMMRYLLANAEDDSQATGDVYKAVAFSGTNLNPDRATSLETSLASIATQMENIAVSVRTVDDRQKGFEQRLRTLEDRDRYSSGGRRYPSYDRNNRSDSYGSRGDRRSRDSWDNRGPRGRPNPPRGYSPRDGRGDRRDRNNDRSRRDRRDSGSRGDDAGRSRDYSRDGEDRGQNRDYSDDRRSERRDDRNYRRDDRAAERGGRRQNYARGGRDRGDAFRAVDTGDERSSDEYEEAASDTTHDQQPSCSEDESSSSTRGRGGN